MPPKKRLRTSQACDFCSKRSIRCHPSEEDASRCQNCVDFDISCTYNRPMRRRGQKKHASASESNSTATSRHNEAAIMVERGAPRHDDGQISNSDATQSLRLSQEPLVLDESDQIILSRAWRSFAAASEGTIKDLMGVYFEVVYPIFPWFHRKTLWEKISNQDHLYDRGFFACVMGACALAAMRLRDGAAFWDRNLPNPSPESFMAAAKDAIPRDLTLARGSDFVRAAAIISLAKIQDGQIRAMQQYLGIYHTLAALENLSNEDLWAKADAVETEERRCLFWSMYTFEVFSSTVWGGIIRNRESQSHVYYPKKIDLETITGDGSPENLTTESWLVGWNMTTDLYRILEHAIDYFRSTRLRTTPRLSLYDNAPPNVAILNQVQDMYNGLSEKFKTFPPISSRDNLFGFQATNIQATLALVRLIIFASEEGAGVDRKCDVAGEVLAAFSQIPAAYMKAMGSLLLHHLAGIGTILSSAVQAPLSEASYSRIRLLLLEMAGLLERLESGMHRSGGASDKIKEHVQLLDTSFNSWVADGSQFQLSAKGPTLAPGAPDATATDFMEEPQNATLTPLWQVPIESFDWPWAVGPDYLMPPLGLD